MSDEPQQEGPSLCFMLAFLLFWGGVVFAGFAVALFGMKTLIETFK